MPDTYSPIPELNSLHDLDKAQVGNEYLSAGFEFLPFGDSSWVQTWSADSDFLNGVLPFAQANASASVYALWRIDDRSELVTLPVVVFGDEGGFHVVARSLRELFQLLSYDAEMVVAWDMCYMLRDEDDYSPSGGHEAYVAWLQREVGLAPVQDPDPIMTRAQSELGEQFAAWMARYYTDS